MYNEGSRLVCYEKKRVVYPIAVKMLNMTNISDTPARTAVNVKKIQSWHIDYRTARHFFERFVYETLFSRICFKNF